MMASLTPAIVEATNSINNARACPVAPHKRYELHRPCTSFTAIININQLSESHKSFNYQLHIHVAEPSFKHGFSPKIKQTKIAIRKNYFSPQSKNYKFGCWRRNKTFARYWFLKLHQLKAHTWFLALKHLDFEIWVASVPSHNLWVIFYWDQRNMLIGMKQKKSTENW